MHPVSNQTKKIYLIKFGSTNDIIRTAIPEIKTKIVLAPAPFHSLSSIPQTLLNVTFNDIRILHENASITGLSVK